MRLIFIHGWKLKDETYANHVTLTDGHVTKVKPEAKGETINLIADWQEHAKYTVSYNANGGNGTMDSQNSYVDDSVNAKTNEFTKEHHEFSGWNTQDDGAGNSYKEGEYEARENVSDMEKWTAIKPDKNWN
ncbi:MAG: InlB B-repeat-containing protein [Clostridia bacterium]|nr:InlB B-repeat-containing protein [Clostridia bacterium]